MIVFSNYFKIVKKHLGLIIMFATISIGVSIVNTSYSNTESYVSVIPDIAIINYDNSELTHSFIKYLEKNTKIVEVEDNEKEIQDALYANEVDAILIIPKHFGFKLRMGKSPEIKIKKSIQNASEYIELIVNRYLNIAEVYSSAGMPEKEIISKIENDLAKQVEVKALNGDKSDLEKLAIYYSFENYAFLSIFIFIIGTIMCIFNKETIKKRNNVSKLNSRTFSIQLFMGHLVLSLCVWAIFVIVSFIIYKDLMLNMNAMLLIINSLCFTLTATSIAYLFGSMIKNQNIISGIQNVISLSLSFISGCFVPIELLDENIVNFSKLFPSYWFIKGNYDIVELTSFNFETIKPIMQNMIIVLVFGIVYFIISQLIKRKTL